MWGWEKILMSYKRRKKFFGENNKKTMNIKIIQYMFKKKISMKNMGSKLDWVCNSFMLGVKHAFSHKFQQYNKRNIQRKKNFLSAKNNDLPGVSSGGDSMFIHHSALDLATVVLKTF